MASDIWEDEGQNKVIKSGNINKKVHHARSRELVALNDWSKHVISYQFALDPNYLTNREFRFIDNPVFECFLEIVIKGDYIKMACAEGDEIWGLKIKSPALAKTLLSIYNLTWQLGTPITEEIVKSWGENGIRKAELSQSN